MKRIILIALLCFPVIFGYAQNSVFGIYGGGGSSINYSYDADISGGLSFVKVGNGRTGFGAQLFFQGYAFKYDNEANAIHGGDGNAGMIILNKSNYIFVAPKISQFFGKHSNMEAYLNVGAGFKMSGTETMRKWDNSYNYSVGGYDSTINTSNNINTMLFRFGMGLNEYIHLGGGNWWFTFTEDFGFVTSSMTKTSDVDYPSRTQYSPAHKLDPAVISFQIGISHSKTQYSE